MIKEKILKAIEQFSLLDGTSEVTVAVSGGADSMSLLFALNQLKAQLNITLYAAHFNHKLRGDEADRDEAFVRKYCEKAGIPLFSGSADVKEYAKSNKLSLELAARNKRYEFLKSVAKGRVATAHSADDNLETVLFNLTRGTALKGLCGIPPKRDIFIRPLIFCERAEIEEYCKQNNIPFVIDSTNLTDAYARNKIRHNAVPVLKKINKGLTASLSRTVLSLGLDDDYLTKEALKEFDKRYKNGGLALKDFDSLHKAISLRVLKLFYGEKISAPPENNHLERLYKAALSNGKISLPEDKSAYILNDCLFIENEKREAAVKYLVEIIKETKKAQKINGLFLNNALDCDKIAGELIVRTRNTGDKISLFNRNGTKSLKKLYTEHSVPQNERETLPVIADSLGVVWVCGIGVAKRAAIDENTKNIYRIITKKGE